MKITPSCRTMELERQVLQINEFLDSFDIRGGTHRGYVRIFNMGDNPSFRSGPVAPPPGRYMGQCKNADMAGPILRALCKASDGSRVDTTINTLDCRGRDISVKPNGKLT